MYPSLNEAKKAVSYCGDMIKNLGLPKQFGPLTFVFTGSGNVTQGALELFKLLPHEFIEPNDLEKIQSNFDNHKVKCIIFEIPQQNVQMFAYERLVRWIWLPQT